MILVTGEILFDLFPIYKRIGGAPFNFDFHLKGLGFPVRFISRVGNDAHGKEILDFLEQNKFNTFKKTGEGSGILRYQPGARLL